MQRKLLVCGLILLVFLISGCWDTDEINRRETVVALGIDAAPEGKVEVTAQIPLVVDLMARTAGGEVIPKPFYIISGLAESAFAATPVIQSKTTKNLFYGLIQVVIIDSTLAKEGLLPYLDFIDRHPDIPPQAPVLLTESKAKEILDAAIISKELPAVAIRKFLTSAFKTDLAYPLRVWRLIGKIESDSENAYLPFIEYNQNEQSFAIHGLGVFHRDRLAGKLSDNETRMFGLMAGKAFNTYLTLPLDGDKKVTYRGVKARSRMVVSSYGDNISVTIKVDIKGFLVESTRHRTEYTLKDLNSIIKKTENALKNEMLKTIQRLQELNSDILGLGELIRATRPEIWRKLDWDKEFPRFPIFIKPRFEIDRTGTYR